VPHNQKIVVITGPTASGKTQLALDLALELGGEIVNSDSVQVYRGLDIGSAKPTKEEQNLVKHHLLSYVEPSEIYSAGRFRKDCLSAVSKLLENDRLPILVGGSGLYISALFSSFLDNGWLVYDVNNFISKVKALKPKADFEFWAHKLLEIVDPIANKKLPLNDLFRRERALSLSLSFGAPFSTLKNSLSTNGEKLGGLVIVLERDREDLYNRIDNRVKHMINGGIIDEVQSLAKIYGGNAPCLKAIGYSQVLDYLTEEKQGLTSGIEDLIKIIQRDTRRFAKRQLTWWRNQPTKLAWLDLLTLLGFVEMIKESPPLTNSTGKEVVVDNQEDNKDADCGVSFASVKVVEGALEGRYHEVKLFLTHLIEYFRAGKLSNYCDSLDYANSETLSSYRKNNKSDLVYICRVRCIE